MSNFLNSAVNIRLKKLFEEGYKNLKLQIFSKSREFYGELFEIMEEAAKSGTILPVFSEDEIFSILLNIVICDYMLDRYDNGMKFIEYCVKFKPSQCCSYMFAILFSLFTENPNIALKNCDVAMKQFPGIIDFILIKSIVEQLSNNYEESLKLCNQAMELDAGSPFANILKGDTLKYHESTQDRSEILVCYQRAQKLDPVCATQYIGRGFLSTNKKYVNHVKNTTRRYFHQTLLPIFHPPQKIQVDRTLKVEGFLKFSRILGYSLDPDQESRSDPNIEVILENKNHTEIIHRDGTSPRNKKTLRKRKRKKRINRHVNVKPANRMKTSLNFGKYNIRDHRPYRKHWKEKGKYSNRKCSPKKRFLGKILKIDPVRPYEKPWLVEKKKNKISKTSKEKSKKITRIQKTTKKVQKKKKTNLSSSFGSTNFDTSRNRGNYEKPWLDNAYTKIRKRIEEEKKSSIKEDAKLRSKSAGPGFRGERGGILRFSNRTGSFELSSTLDEDDLMDVKKKKHDEEITDHNHKLYRLSDRYTGQKFKKPGLEKKLANSFCSSSKWKNPLHKVSIKTSNSYSSGDKWTIDSTMKLYRTMFVGYNEFGRKNDIIGGFLDIKPKKIHFV